MFSYPGSHFYDMCPEASISTTIAKKCEGKNWFSWAGTLHLKAYFELAYPVFVVIFVVVFGVLLITMLVVSWL